MLDGWPECLLCLQNIMPLPLNPLEQFLLNILTLLLNKLVNSIINNTSKLIHKLNKLLTRPVVDKLLPHSATISIITPIIIRELPLSPRPSIKVTLFRSPVNHRSFKPRKFFSLIGGYRGVQSLPTSE